MIYDLSVTSIDESQVVSATIVEHAESHRVYMRLGGFEESEIHKYMVPPIIRRPGAFSGTP